MHTETISEEAGTGVDRPERGAWFVRDEKFDVAVQLLELNQLRADGLVTEAEFASRASQLLTDG
ncbi:MAG: hypothetical protein HYX32_11370 [Actinobacteria bacterium]|nr:hypothetical protein [Actinomycetota bacterium]